MRYWKGHVYSYTGPILIAVNPWKSVRTSFDIVIFVDVDQNSLLQVDIYNINVLERHKASACKEPHIFGIVSRAFRFRFLIEQATRQQCDMATGFALQGADELKEKSVHSDIWRVRLRKDRKHEVCFAGCVLDIICTNSPFDRNFEFDMNIEFQVLTASGENRTGASASIEQQVMLTNPGQKYICCCVLFWNLADC